ncbi:MAG: YebC/PmpR family DNA-binding transcriptional regulator [Clostridia bacterium]
MSGHSKWANIKRKKEGTDAKRGKVFTKIGREIAVAVKEGGADPDSNAKLRDLISKAKANNLPNDNIIRSIKKASGELGTVNYEEITYEGYGAGGVAVIVETLTDNKNRTAGDVRHIFDKCGGALGTNGCVSYMFEKKGVILVDKGDLTEDDIMEIALEAGADDIQTTEDVYEIYTSVQDFSAVREALEANKKLTVLSSDFDMIANNYIDPEEKLAGSIIRLIDMLEDNDDVQNVYHNAEFPEEE